jgi:predicted dehydrogenase
VRALIVGSGLQASRRAPAIASVAGSSVVAVVGPDAVRARAVAEPLGAAWDADVRGWLSRDDVDAVVICTPPDVHREIALAALAAGKHVLCEKPLAMTSAEAREMVGAAAARGRVLKCGFNHRHHPAVAAMKAHVEAGGVGRPLFGRAIYGFGGRPSMAGEWRADPRRTAGGHLMEQGIHAIDLFRWLTGEPHAVTCRTATAVFPIEPLEDNAFCLLEREDGFVASVHASLLQWRNRFEIELYGTDGYAAVAGLGGSYGTERLVVASRDPSAPFAETITEYRAADPSWRLEWEELCCAASERRVPLGSGEDGVAAMELVEAAYRSARTGRRVAVGGRDA